MLVEMLREKRGDLVLMHFHWSVWHLPLPVTLDMSLTGPGWGGR